MQHCDAVGSVSSSKYEDSADTKLPVLKVVCEPAELSSVDLAYWDSPEKTRTLITYCCIRCPYDPSRSSTASDSSDAQFSVIFY